MSKVSKKILSQTFQLSWFDRETHGLGREFTVSYLASKSDSETENLKIAGQVSRHSPLH